MSPVWYLRPDVVMDGIDPEPYIWPEGFTYDASLAREAWGDTPGKMQGCASAPADRGVSSPLIAVVGAFLVLRRRRRASPGLHSLAARSGKPSVPLQ